MRPAPAERECPAPEPTLVARKSIPVPGMQQKVAGRSLLELVSVLGLLGLLGASAATNWHGWRAELALQAATRQVVADLAFARLRAAATNRSHRLLLLAGETSYRLQWNTGSGYADVRRPLRLPSGVQIASCNAAGAAFTYRPRGNAATFGTLTLANDVGRQRLIVVDIAGRVRVQ